MLANACDVASFTNRLQEMISDVKTLGLVTLTLVTDDLYQCCLSTMGLTPLYIHRAATILLQPLFSDDRIVWYVNDYDGRNTSGLDAYYAYLLGALDNRNVAVVHHAPIESTTSKSASKLSGTSLETPSGTDNDSSAAEIESKIEEKSKSKSTVNVAVATQTKSAIKKPAQQSATKIGEKSEEKPQLENSGQQNAVLVPADNAAAVPANQWQPPDVPPGGVWADDNLGIYFTL